MSPIRVRAGLRWVAWAVVLMSFRRSIYQDIPLYTLEEFKVMAPEEARGEDVLSDQHQLMLNRLSFELAERQRYCRGHIPSLWSHCL